MKTILQDLKSNYLSMNEAIDVAKNHSLWRLVVHARKEEEVVEAQVEAWRLNKRALNL